MASEPATAVELEEEQRLVEEAQAGNLDSMRPILERYAQPLFGTVILPRLGDAASAEEVLRDTLATAVEKLTWNNADITFELTEKQAMVGGTELTGDVVVTARYDQDGDALSKEAGDIVGTARVKLPADNVQIWLDTSL